MSSLWTTAEAGASTWHRGAMTSPRGPQVHAVPESPEGARVVLDPAVRVLWRAADCVQLELGDRALVIDGVDPAAITALAGRAAACPAPAGVVPAGMHRDDIRRLTAAGFATVVPPGAPPAGTIPTLAGELAALTARRGAAGSAAFSARAHRCIAIVGAGRIGAHLAAVLAASGVGRVAVTDHSTVRLTHPLPGGVAPADEGRRHSEAAADAVARAVPGADTTPLVSDHEPDLTVVAVDEPLDDERREDLHERGRTHLVARIGPGFAAIGPLVVPGFTSCLRCADLHRRDRDPAWPALAVQLSVPPRYGTASETALATLAVGVTSLQVLQYLDGAAPATIDGTLELHQPDWRLRRRSWSRHPDCDCGEA